MIGVIRQTQVHVKYILDRGNVGVRKHDLNPLSRSNIPDQGSIGFAA